MLFMHTQVFTKVLGLTSRTDFCKLWLNATLDEGTTQVSTHDERLAIITYVLVSCGTQESGLRIVLSVAIKI